MVKSRIGMYGMVLKGKVNPPFEEFGGAPCTVKNGFVSEVWYERRRDWYEKYGMKIGEVSMKSIVQTSQELRSCPAQVT